MKSDYDNAVLKIHEHSNKAILDNTTASYTTEEQSKLNGIEDGAEVNTVTGIKGDAETEYRTGNINITRENIGLENVANERQWSDNNHPTTVVNRDGSIVDELCGVCTFGSLNIDRKAIMFT
ncbi:MAG: hypothetical protein ACI4SA_07105 [Lachnospiraceae bacterium]